MPEGPEIRRAADSLEAAIQGKPLTDVWFAFPQLKPFQSQLVGQTVTHIETRGKALLTHFSHNLTLYSHNQLYGVWRVVKANEQPQTNRVLRVRLQTADNAILLYSASDIEMLTPEQLRTHPFLLRVGPDVLDTRLTASDVKARLLALHFVTDSFPGCCSTSAFWPGWVTTCGWKFCGTSVWPRSIRQQSCVRRSLRRYLTRCWTFRVCRTTRAARWMTTGIMARCFVLRCFIGKGRRVSAAAG